MLAAGSDRDQDHTGNVPIHCRARVGVSPEYRYTRHFPESTVPRYQFENGESNQVRAAGIRGSSQSDGNILRRAQAGVSRGHTILPHRAVLGGAGREIRMG